MWWWWWDEQCEQQQQIFLKIIIIRLLFNDDHSWALDLFLLKRIIASLFYGGTQPRVGLMN